MRLSEEGAPKSGMAYRADHQGRSGNQRHTCQSELNDFRQVHRFVLAIRRPIYRHSTILAVGCMSKSSAHTSVVVRSSYWLAAQSGWPQRQEPGSSTPARHDGEQYSPAAGTTQVHISWAHCIEGSFPMVLPRYPSVPPMKPGPGSIDVGFDVVGIEQVGF